MSDESIWNQLAGSGKTWVTSRKNCDDLRQPTVCSVGNIEVHSQYGRH